MQLALLALLPACKRPLTGTYVGYGQDGPYKTAPGYDVIIEAEAGLMHMYAKNMHSGQIQLRINTC